MHFGSALRLHCKIWLERCSISLEGGDVSGHDATVPCQRNDFERSWTVGGGK